VTTATPATSATVIAARATVRYDFSGRVALVTGGTDGIGLAVAQAFVDAGAHVLVAGRDTARGARALEQLNASRIAAAHFVAADMGVDEDVVRMMRECGQRFARIDYAVNNAAAEFPLVKLAEMPLHEVDRTLDVNLRAVWLCMKLQIEAMLPLGGGAIVNVSSVNGFASSVNAAVYSASKHGMNGLSTAAAREYIQQGIRINTVCPGAIETPRRQRRLTGFTQEQVVQHYESLAQQIPIGRVATAEEVAAGVLWLCSDAAQYVVGHHLVIDGGLSA
jgi:NAD(P)-dependent dehydrogenase (short-subunit alcohol dehydrogenase family)